MLTDHFGRIHSYLRISITESCNFRCSYCMPTNDYHCLPSAQQMGVDEIESIAKAFVGMGVSKIRLTGGEPLVRRDFADILRRLSALGVEISITTNGFLVDKFLPLFREVGLRSLNLSLDSLDKARFDRITGRNAFDRVWGNALKLLDAGIRVKMNTVALHDTVMDELPRFLDLTKGLPLHVRFIEFMPFAGNGWEHHKVITAAQMLAMVQERYDIVKLKDEPHATAKKYKIVGHEGTFAFITTMSEHFCGSCNRLRVTADGKIKNCLFGKDEFDLLGALRGGEDLAQVIHQAVKAKHPVMGGQFAGGYTQRQAESIENRSMVKIGG
ncbi:MAG: GTP 3',8-cyclase MoaA [Bacteroidetes bacterium]|nr:GTP 3',8-cyclase MoaA [Bacteroidota bacterium]